MAAVLIASDLAKDMAGEPLFRGISFKLERRDRLTIAGRNGAGKTTLLRMLAGETGIDGGELHVGKGVRIALHDQRPPRERDLTLRDYVLSGNPEPQRLEAELTRLEEAMASGDEKALNAYSDAYARFEAVGGYGWRDAANATIHGLGFTDDDLDRLLATFSGGQLTRASLARALSAKPDLLLLDEPTNHLDLETLEWLEQTLTSLDAAIVLIAHDRWFLEAVGTSVLDLEAGRGRFFKGTWTQWRKEQAMREMALGKAIAKQEAEIARLEGFVARFSAKATKAKQAQSRVKRLDKIEKIERDPKDQRSLGLSFKPPERSGRIVFELEHGHLEVGEGERRKVLIEDGDLWIERGEHVSLVGPNGVGKTTLIDALAGKRPFDDGRLRSGHNVKVAYLSQHGEELEFGGARTVVEACAKRTGLAPNQARALLGRFLFSGDEAEKPLDGLSGGERKRLGLVILVSSGANVLILDEPTNHLDIESREALEDALSSFEGSLLLVSHDRAMLEAIGSRTVAVEDFGLRSYVGGWQEYLEVRDERIAAGHVPPPAPKPRARSGHGPTDERDADGRAIQRSAGAPAAANGNGNGNGNGAKANGNGAAAKAAAAKQADVDLKAARAAEAALSKNARKQQAKLETAVETAEAAFSRLEDELADPARWATSYESAQSTARHTAAKRAVEDAYAALEAFEEKAPA